MSDYTSEREYDTEQLIRRLRANACVATPAEVLSLVQEVVRLEFAYQSIAHAELGEHAGKAVMTVVVVDGSALFKGGTFRGMAMVAPGLSLEERGELADRAGIAVAQLLTVIHKDAEQEEE